MKFGFTNKAPLLKAEIIHSLPGRIRCRCRALKFLGRHIKEINHQLGIPASIKSVKISPVTGSILIYYHDDKLNAHSLVETIEAVIGSYSKIAFHNEKALTKTSKVQERKLQEESAYDMSKRVAITALTLFFACLRRPKAAPLSIIGRFLTMPAISAIVLSKPIFESGFEAIRDTKRPNADTLSATAILSSLAAGRDISALVIIWLADIAETLTAYTMERTRNAIHEMISAGEDKVWRIKQNGREELVNIEKIKIGDRVVNTTGEKISVDGIIESGEALIDESTITGEFIPHRKSISNDVFAGTVVKTGRIIIKVCAVGDNTAVARIVHLVQDAIDSKAPVQLYADRFSAAFIPVNFLLALVVFAVTKSATRALNMLIIDYSCGVRLSTATALSASIYTAAKHGVLIKGSSYIEMATQADTLVLDKTGTVTEGKPEVKSIIPFNKMTREQVLGLCAAAEEKSGHPMAVAILQKASAMRLEIPQHTQTKVHVAKGVETRVKRSIIRAGSRKYMIENKIDIESAKEDAARLGRRGENIIYVSKGPKIIGLIGIQDTLRENMKKSLNRLRMLGMDDIILLTGDLEQHAEVIATHMGMDRYHSEMLPEDKSEVVLKLQSRGVKIIAVGDGINDGPALAYADVGVAMGTTRTDLAMEAADIVINGDDPLMIPELLKLSNNTMSIINQNFATSILVNTLGLALSTIGVLPVFWGAVLHNTCTVMVVLNSGRLLTHSMTGEGR